MALLAKQVIVPAGLEPTYSAANAGGDTLRPSDHVVLHVKNGDASPHTVTINDPTSKSPPGAAQFDPDLSVTVPAGEERMIGPIDERFSDSSIGGQAAITYDGVTSVTVAVLTVG